MHLKILFFGQLTDITQTTKMDLNESLSTAFELDAFLKKGSGFGRTLNFISPTLRIDYILADKELEIDRFHVIKVPYSDHYPLVADMRFPGDH